MTTMTFPQRLLYIFLFISFASTISAATITASPSDYLSKLSNLKAGDTLVLAPGNYQGGFNITDLKGTANAWITITGPETGTPATIEGRSCCNTVQIRRSEYVIVKNLRIDNKGLFVDGVNAKDGPSHHIIIENNTLVNFAANQQIVGVSTKDVAWDWVVRGNTIIEPGTGMYFGNSDGQYPFIRGVVESNLIINPIGYCAEFKHQNSRPVIAGMPTGNSRTIIRNNVFIKDSRPSPYGSRPNLLVDGFPDSGTGSGDIYEIYGNFLYNNPRESLLQMAGRASVHDNIFVQPSTSQYAAYFADHNRPLKLVRFYNNTIYGGSEGVRFGSTPREAGMVIGNLIFSGIPIGASNRISTLQDNITNDIARAVDYVRNPSFTLGGMDFYPLAGMASGTPLDMSQFQADTDYARDFNGAPKGAFEFRGAYAGEGTNPGWALDAKLKPPLAAVIGLPTPPANLKIRVH